MKRIRIHQILAVTFAAIAACSPALAQEGAGGDKEQPAVDTLPDDPTAVLGFTMESIDGEALPLEEYRGDVAVMVNVASRCGLTPQYEGLQSLYERFKDRGFVVLGFPANDFGGQEPGSDKEILEFCTSKFDVSFPMFSKISVIGEDRHPLYAKLAGAMEEQGGEPTWNFTKYLVDRNGDVVKRFDPRTKPDDERFVAAIEELLKAPRPERAADTEVIR